MKVTVWEDKKSGKLFKNEKDYNDFCNQRKAEAKKQMERKNLLKLYDMARLTATDFDDYAKKLTDAINKVQNVKQRVVSITFSSIRYNEQVPNSHSCPINGVTNWRGDKDKPRGYPGWYGYVNIIMDRESSGFTNRIEYSHLPGFNPGSGGVVSHGVRYDIKLFEDDFPLIKKRHQENMKKKDYQEKVDLMKGVYELKLRDNINEYPDVTELKKKQDSLKLRMESLINTLKDSMTEYAAERENLIKKYFDKEYAFVPPPMEE